MKNSFLIKIYKYKFKPERKVSTSKHALSDGNVGLTRLWGYKGQKHPSKLHTVTQKCEKSEVSLKEFMALVHEPIKKATKVISAANAFAEAGKNAGTANSNRLQAAVAHGSAGWPPPGDNSTHL